VTSDPDAALMMLVRTIAAGDSTAALAMLDAQPELARIALTVKGATRQDAKAHFLDDIGHYVYQGDTALHIAAAGYRTDIVRRLIALGSDLGAKNRLGAEPLHLAAMGTPGAPRFDPPAQATTIICLIEAGSNPNARDKQGVAPLHRAVRTRCAAAVQALLAGGADPRQTNKSGSTPMKLAQMTTGRGGSGSPDAKAQQQEIVRLLREALA
jgi:Ankyrin repeats (many copies)/Ankyrin repeats (3 copies)